MYKHKYFIVDQNNRVENSMNNLNLKMENIDMNVKSTSNQKSSNDCFKLVFHNKSKDHKDKNKENNTEHNEFKLQVDENTGSDFNVNLKVNMDIERSDKSEKTTNRSYKPQKMDSDRYIMHSLSLNSLVNDSDIKELHSNNNSNSNNNNNSRDPKIPVNNNKIKGSGSNTNLSTHN